MDPLRQYEIAFVGLRPGVHEFNFEIDERFFRLFEGSLVRKGGLKVKLIFDKGLSFFLLHFTINGTVQLDCDRCAAALNFPVDSDYPIVVKFDEHSEVESDDSMADVVYINRNDSHIDVSQLIYEFINLSIPFNHVNCDNLNGQKPCNQDILNRINQIPEKKEISKDPRWDSLSKIKFN